jgi:hypothetical protein
VSCYSIGTCVDRVIYGHRRITTHDNYCRRSRLVFSFSSLDPSDLRRISDILLLCASEANYLIHTLSALVISPSPTFPFHSRSALHALALLIRRLGLRLFDLSLRFICHQYPYLSSRPTFKPFVLSKLQSTNLHFR